ncbi:MAG TPA: LPS assembly protein LptD [Gammaproteobacteria bacterium]|nr:LPS assembly protein LptD [Gammaproteobacteria bacterium]
MPSPALPLIAVMLLAIGVCRADTTAANASPPLPPSEDAVEEAVPAADVPVTTSASETWRLCTTPAAPPPPPPPPRRAAADEPLRITADRVTGRYGHGYTFEGNVEALQGDRTLRADHIEHDDTEGQILARGNVSFGNALARITGPEATFDTTTDSTSMRNAELVFPARHLRGTAARVETEGTRRSRLEEAMFTTCDPGTADWTIRAADMDLDHVSGFGTARHVVVDFMHLPIFYTPYISFPIDERRKTGFLFPEIGGSGRSGTIVGWPWYWNIAPSLDATLTPRYLSERGWQFLAENRYLTAGSTGEIDFSYLPDDRKRDAERWYGRYNHKTRFAENWVFDVAYRDVSDEFYFQDFGEKTGTTSIVNLSQSAGLRQDAEWYTFSARATRYFKIDPAELRQLEPYSALPRIAFQTRLPPTKWFEYGLGLEATDFQADDRVSGSRFNALPRLSFPFGGAAWFATPSLSYSYTSYDLEEVDGSRLELERTAPIYSLDAGLFLEREAGAGLLQTLEPRIFYLRVPFRDHRDIPRFDTIPLELSYATLFEENRFAGIDRLGDADQLSVALGSRLIDADDGRTLLSAGVGQILYFADRRVVFGNNDPLSPTYLPDTRETSDYAAELRLTPDDQWTMTADALWDPEERHYRRAAASLQYRPDEKTVVNLAYRFRRDALEQSDVSFAWPVHRNIRLVGRWNYSLPEHRTLETFGGIEYETCCWALRLIARRYIVDTEGAMDRTFYLQLELKGLSSVGRDADEFLGRGIPGYGLPGDDDEDF